MSRSPTIPYSAWAPVLTKASMSRLILIVKAHPAFFLMSVTLARRSQGV
jgi:hypothetical protein